MGSRLPRQTSTVSRTLLPTLTQPQRWYGQDAEPVDRAQFQVPVRLGRVAACAPDEGELRFLGLRVAVRFAIALFCLASVIGVLIWGFASGGVIERRPPSIAEPATSSAELDDYGAQSRTIPRPESEPTRRPGG